MSGSMDVGGVGHDLQPVLDHRVSVRGFAVLTLVLRKTSFVCACAVTQNRRMAASNGHPPGWIIA